MDCFSELTMAVAVAVAAAVTRCGHKRQYIVYGSTSKLQKVNINLYSIKGIEFLM